MDDVRRRRSGAAQRHNRIGAMMAVIIVTLLLLYCYISITSNMNPAAVTLAEARTKAMVTEALNDAIIDTVEQYAAGIELLDISRTEDGVYLIVANTVAMNTVAAHCIEFAQDAIAAFAEQGVSVPLGTMTNIPFLAGVGPQVSFKFAPVGSVESDFTSELTSAGINQTLYKVNLKLAATVSLIMPTQIKTLDVSASAAIAESVIVGDVPEVYTNVPEEDMTNLIPTDPLD
ncbi:MAG: sporulation protein YunB [Clostridia bacterium]|nr:sporulation protein YunB [Clostridia bacterium]